MGRHPKRRKKKPDQRALGHGVFVVLNKDKQPYQFVLRQPRSLIARFGVRGEALMHGFLVGLNASERLASLAHLLTVNDEHVSAPSIKERNDYALISLILATFYEALDAIELLETAGLTGRLGDFAPWKVLREMKQRGQKDSYVYDVRNTLGAHLGRDALLRGLKMVEPLERLILIDHSAGMERFNETHPIVTTLLEKGMRARDGTEYSPEQRREKGLLAVQDLGEFSMELERCMFRMMRLAGVHLHPHVGPHYR